MPTILYVSFLVVLTSCISVPPEPSKLATVVGHSLHSPQGPLFMGQDLFYVEYGTHAVMRFDGKQSHIFWRQSGCGPTALARLGSDIMVTCYDANKLVRLSPMGNVVRAYDKDQAGSPLGGPKGMSPDAVGGLYFTTSGAWNRAAPGEGAVYYLTAKEEINLLTPRELHYPSSLAVSPDGKRLLVAEQLENRIIAYSIATAGQLSVKHELFSDLKRIPPPSKHTTPDEGPAGLFLTETNTLYVTQFGGGRILKLDSVGELIEQFIIPDPWVSGVALAGKRLAITSQKEAKDGSGQLVIMDERND